DVIFVHRCGDLLAVRIARSVVEGSDPPAILVQLSERTSTRHAERLLHLAHDRMVRVFEGLRTGALIEDDSRMIIYANTAFCRIAEISVPPTMLVGRSGSSIDVHFASMAADPVSFSDAIAVRLARRAEVRFE